MNKRLDHALRWQPPKREKIKFPYRRSWWAEWNDAFGTSLTAADAERIKRKVRGVE